MGRPDVSGDLALALLALRRAGLEPEVLEVRPNGPCPPGESGRRRGRRWGPDPHPGQAALDLWEAGRSQPAPPDI